jgi:hypothetical protein
MLGKRNAAALLDRTLKEESQTDELLSQIAEDANRSAEGKSAGRKAPAKRSGGSSRSRSGRKGSAAPAGDAAGAES